MRAVSRIMLILIALTAVFAVPAMASDVTIPINKDYQSGNMTVHLILVNITDYTMGNEFTPYGKDNTIWPKLVYTYENKGSVPENGYLFIIFHDDRGDTYESHDVTMDMVQPGKTTTPRFKEVPVEKGRKITQVEIVEGFRHSYYPLQYPTATPSIPLIPGVSNFPSTQTCCCAPLLLPLLAIGALFVSKRKRD